MKSTNSFRASYNGLAKVRRAGLLAVATALACVVAAAQVLVPLDQSGTPAQTQRPTPTADPGKYIVNFTPGTSRAARAQAAIQSGASVSINYQTLNAIAITVPNVNALNGLRNNPNVLGIYPDYQFSHAAKPLPPGQPTLNSVVPASDSVINLAWTNGAGGDPPEYYEIDRCIGIGCLSFSLVATVSAPQTSYADSGLAPATLYRYRVRACITRGGTPCSPYSAPGQATTNSATPPIAPSGLSANPVSQTQVNLTWADNSGNEQGFRVFRCTGSGCAPTVQHAQLATPNLSSYNDTTSVAAGTIYRYQVVAYNTAGNSTPSNIAEAQTPAAPTAPAAPSSLSANPSSPTQVDLTWVDNSGNEDGFRVFRCTGSGCTPTVQLVQLSTPNLTGYSDASAAGGITYRYHVVAYNAVGPSPASNIAEAQTPPAPTAPAAPSGLSATPVGPTQVDLMWTDSANNENGFRVFRCSGASCTPTLLIQIATVDLQSYSDTAVTQDTLYSYYVVAYNAVGPSPQSNQQNIQTPPLSSAPNAPSNLAITSVSSSAIGMSWNDNSSDETGFQIERCTGTSCGGFAFVASVGAGSTSYSDSAVADDTTYGYRVRAVKSGEFSGYSNSAEGTTSPIASPPPAETPITGGRRQKVPAGVQRVGPPGLLDDGVTPSDGAGIGIAVLDSGLDYAHLDLALDPEVPGTNSFNGFAPGSSAQDDRGHGTHVAGIIAARNNNIGVVGVAPNATLYSVKVLAASGTGNESISTAGLDWVLTNHNLVDPPIRIVNMSLGRVLGAGETVNDPTPFHQAIQALYNLGIVVVASAGNEPTLETTAQVPSGYAEVLAVAGTVAEPGQNACPPASFPGIPTVAVDAAAIFTSDGQYVPGIGGVTTSAPSEERNDTLQTGTFTCSVAINGIQSTRLGGGISRLIPVPGAPSEAVGTSFAAPHVAGVVARIMQTNHGIASADSAGVEAIRSEIRNTADRRQTAPPDPNEPPPAPVDNQVAANLGLYTFDGEREGIAQAP